MKFVLLLIAIAHAFYDTVSYSIYINNNCTYNFYFKYLYYDEERALTNHSFAYWEWSIREDQGSTALPAMGKSYNLLKTKMRFQVRDFGPTVPWGWRRETTTESDALSNGISCMLISLLAFLKFQSADFGGNKS